MIRVTRLPGRWLGVFVVLAATIAASMSFGASAGAAVRSDDDRDEVRVRGVCGTGAAARLRLRARDDSLELEFEIDAATRGSSWRVIVVHERRVAWKGAVQAKRSSGGSLKIRRVLPDLAGADTVTVRAWGPQGTGCRATATLVEI